MEIAIAASGSATEINATVALQIKRARQEHPALSATLASLRDDIAKAIGNGHGSIDITIKPAISVVARLDGAEMVRDNDGLISGEAVGTIASAPIAPTPISTSVTGRDRVAIPNAPMTDATKRDS